MQKGKRITISDFDITKGYAGKVFSFRGWRNSVPGADANWYQFVVDNGEFKEKTCFNRSFVTDNDELKEIESFVLSKEQEIRDYIWDCRKGYVTQEQTIKGD